MPNETQRAVDKRRAYLNAEYDLHRKLDKIDWRHDVLLPEIEGIRNAGAINATTEPEALNEGGTDDAAGEPGTDHNA